MTSAYVFVDYCLPDFLDYCEKGLKAGPPMLLISAAD